MPVSFPNLHLTFQIDPVAISLGKIHIYWYGILIASAISLSLYLIKRRDGLYGISFEKVVDYSVIAIIVGVICARFYYVMFRMDYYWNHPLEIIQIFKRWYCYLWWDYRRNRDSLLFLQKT